MKSPFLLSIWSVYDTSLREAVHRSGFTAKQFLEKELHFHRFRDKELRPCPNFSCAYVTCVDLLLSI